MSEEQQKDGAATTGAAPKPPAVKKAASAAASSAELDNGKKIAVLLLIGAVMGVIYFFFSDRGNKDKREDNEPTVVVTPASEMEGTAGGSQAIASMGLPPLPSLKEVQAPPPPPPEMPTIMPPPPPPPILGLPKETSKVAEQQISTAKMKTGIMVFGSGSSDGDKKKSKANDFLGFDNGAIDLGVQPTAAASVAATKVMTPLNRTILQGKVVEAVLETAINTNLPTGMLRAVVTRDVYAEQGHTILLPKGSRLVGTYTYQGGSAGNLAAGSNSSGPPPTRVSAIWNRVITPSGIDVAINSPATDRLGRAGIPGYLDDQWLAQLGSAVLVSYVIPFGIGKATGTLNDTVSVTTGGATPSSSSSSGSGSVTPYSSYQTSAGAMLLQNTSQQFQSVATEVVQDRFSTTPILVIDQGAKIMILVQQDLTFSEDAMQDILSSTQQLNN